MKTDAIFSASLPIGSLATFFSQITRRFLQSSFLDAMTGTFQRFSQPPLSSRMGMQQFKKNFKKNYLLLLPIGAACIIIVVLVGSFFSKEKTVSVQGVQDQRARVNRPLAAEELGKSYTFTINDAAGKPTKVKFEIQNVELRDQIVLRGQSVLAVSGRVFLIVNLKIVNDSTENIGMNTRNYLRLIVDNSADKLAPEIHNDPVQIQAISSKLTRAGFAIDDTAKKLVLQVGEISGKKETIELHLQE